MDEVFGTRMMTGIRLECQHEKKRCETVTVIEVKRSVLYPRISTLRCTVPSLGDPSRRSELGS